MNDSNKPSKFPSTTRIVIMGGGIVGCSTAYHLTKLGWKDVHILERKKLTSGSTFHAAGLVGQLRSSASITRLLKYSAGLYGNLEDETGQATGWRANGSLRLACNQERFTEIKRQSTIARSFGLEMHLLTPKEASELWPMMETSDIVGAAYLPADGQASPSDLCQALAKGARIGGTQIWEDCEVTGFIIRNGRIHGVETLNGTIECEVVVNCCGFWARQVGLMAGVSVPVQAVQHQYLITEPIDGVSEDLPSLRDPDRRCYYKEEVGGLVMGGYEPKPIPWTPKNGIPKDFHFQLLEDNWEQFEQLLIPAIERVPALAEIGIRKMINGPEGFTPDGNFILGEAPELKGFFVSAGFNAYGIAAGGGAGKALAEWIAQGEPSMDLWPVDIRRFGAHHRDTNFLIDRALESSSKHYAMSWPYDEPETGRLLRISPLYYCLKEQRCCFGSKFGWERPNWFAPKSEEPKDIHSYGRQNWFSYVGEEHRHTREGVALFDQTSFAKFLLQGPDAEATLSWICANDVAKPTGRIIYTQLCNQHGGVEADLTVCRLAEDTYYIITGTGYANRDFNWISLHIPKGLQAKLIDVTSMYCVLALMGPQSRRVLSSIVDEDLSNEAFPFATCRDIIIAGTVARAMRITFVGELGWELHIPVESAVTAYNHLMEAGKPYGIVNAGYRAIESLRLEKGYRIWGTDVSPDYTPFEAGLGWAVKLKPQIPFLGRQSLEEKENQRLQKRLAFFAVDDSDTILLGGETIYRNGERVGWLSSGGYGYTLQQGVGMGYVSHANGVDRNYLIAGEYELEVACERVSCSLHLRPVFDPKSTRVKQ